MLIALGLMIMPSILLAQDKEMKKPKDAGIAEFDEFKNKAFGIYKNSLKFKTMVDTGDKFTVEDVRAVDKLQEDARAMKDSRGDYRSCFF